MRFDPALQPGPLPGSSQAALSQANGGRRWVRSLLIEDDPADVRLVERTLETRPGSGSLYRIDAVPTLGAGLDRLAKEDTDVLLLDLHLPDSRGVHTVTRVRERDSEVPIVVFTVTGDDRTALHALREGAQDYLVKGELSGSLLRRSIHYAIERQRLAQENQHLQERLLRARKAESLSTLAGGIAHDFNNLLTVILGNAELSRMGTPTARPALNAIIEATKAASRLTGQLLTYSGQARPHLAPMDLAAQIRRLEEPLRALVPKHVGLVLRLGDGLPPIEADGSQVQGLLAHLVTNAAEAIDGNDGAVEVATGTADLDEGTIRDLVPGSRGAEGHCVYLRVRDSGRGMNQEAMGRIFDPFFTTKAWAHGVGLAFVMGVVRGHGAGLRVQSRPGAGTAFTIFFPASAKPAHRASKAPPSELTGSGRILVVDDEEAVREVTRLSLEMYGYSVIEAETGARAIGILRDQGGRIDLVLLDLAMPDLTGEETLVELRKLQPDLKVVFCTGYDQSDPTPRSDSGRPAGFLPKPYSPEQLAAKVKEALEPPAGSGAEARGPMGG